MRVVVTGGAGFVGSHLVEHLLVQGVASLLVVDNLRRGDLRNLHSHRNDLQFIEGDVRDQDLMMKVMQRANLVYHLAAESSVMGAEENRDYCYSTNYTGTSTVLSAARSAGVRRVVFTSSREVYGQAEVLPVDEDAARRPINFYGATKLLGEMMCQSYPAAELEISIVRLTNIYGPRDFGRVIPIFIRNALKNVPLIIYGGDQVLDLIWIESVLSALFRTGMSPCVIRPLNIGAGNGTSITRLAEAILEHTNSKAGVRYEPKRNFEVGSFVADIRQARTHLGFEPSMDPLSNLQDVIDYMRVAG